MEVEIGHIEAIFRYPVKSMAGESLEAADLGWNGVDGDRRLALRRMQEAGGFPWLTASRLAELLLFRPIRRDGDGSLPTHVRTPDGRELPVFGNELQAEIERRHKAPVQMMHLSAGMFDAATVSVITTDTVGEIAREAGCDPDVRRFRPNVVVRLKESVPFRENSWPGSVLAFGDGSQCPRVSITMPDERCSMINLHPDSARSDPSLLKAAVRSNKNNAGVYGTVIRTGRLAVGYSVFLYPATP